MATGQTVDFHCLFSQPLLEGVSRARSSTSAERYLRPRYLHGLFIQYPQTRFVIASRELAGVNT
jgi:hypothetical protein